MTVNYYDQRIVVWSVDPNHPDWECHASNILEPKTAAEWLTIALEGLVSDPSGTYYCRVTDPNGKLLGEETIVV